MKLLFIVYCKEHNGFSKQRFWHVYLSHLKTVSCTNQRFLLNIRHTRVGERVISVTASTTVVSFKWSYWEDVSTFLSVKDWASSKCKLHRCDVLPGLQFFLLINQCFSQSSSHVENSLRKKKFLLLCAQSLHSGMMYALTAPALQCTLINTSTWLYHVQVTDLTTQVNFYLQSLTGLWIIKTKLN